jgi:hypothetical protein
VKKIPWVRVVLGGIFVIVALVLARRTIVACSRDVCWFGDQRLVGGDVRDVRVGDVERASIDRTMNREGERRSQIVFLMKSGARTPVTPMDMTYKDEVVTDFAAVQNGERDGFVVWYAGFAGYAGGVFGGLGVLLLALAALRVRKVTSSR